MKSNTDQSDTDKGDRLIFRTDSITTITVNIVSIVTGLTSGNTVLRVLSCIAFIASLAILAYLLLGRGQWPKPNLQKFLRLAIPAFIIIILAILWCIVPAIKSICCPVSSTPTRTQTPETPTIEVTSPSPTAEGTAIPTATQVSPIRIGMVLIDRYIYTEIAGRVRDLGFDVTWIEEEFNIEDLIGFDVVYLPVGWGFQGLSIDEYASQFHLYIEGGGGLFVERPNPLGEYVPSLLPFPATFNVGLNDLDDWPPVTVHEHFITGELEEIDLPEAGNRISQFAREYIVLVASRKYSYPTLMIAEYGAGRILITASTAIEHDDISHPMSDEVIIRSLQWIVRRD